MNNSVMKVIGPSLLVLSFIVAPVSPVLSIKDLGSQKMIKAAEAAPISYGTISGIVSFSSTTEVVRDATVNLYLKDSNTLYSTVKTDVNGIFAFVAPQELSYRVELATSDKYVAEKDSLTVVEVNYLKNSFSSISFKVTEIPFIKLFGSKEITVSKGSEFIDPGVILQYEDGNPVRGFAIEANGKVDTSVVGRYLINYSVDSSAFKGFTVKEVTRVVNVVDKNVGLTIVVPGNSIPSKVIVSDSQCNYLNSYLGKSFSNDKLEVLKLQAFLFFKEGNRKVGATGVYDAETELAVRNFQDKYFVDVLSPWGTVDNTGEVRMLTLKKINDIYCGRTSELNSAQKETVTTYKNLSYSKQSAEKKIDEVAVPVEPEKKSIGKKISSWWSGVKKSLIAAFPSFSSKKDKSDDNASTTLKKEEVKTDGVSKDQDLNIATAKEAKESKFSIFATILSAILGFIAFVLAFYIYKKTRGPEPVVEVIKEAKHTNANSTKK